MPAALRVEHRARRWRGVCFLALALVLGPLSLLGAACGLGHGFALLHQRRPQAPSRGAALCARGGETEAPSTETEEAAATPPVIPPENAIPELSRLVTKVYQPKHGETLIKWSKEKRKPSENETLFRATALLTRCNRTFVGSWEQNETAAKQKAAMEALDKRLGDVFYGCPRTTLNIIFRAALGPEKPISFRIEEIKKAKNLRWVRGREKRWRSVAVLPEELFPDGWSPSEDDLMGDAAVRKSDAQMSAANAALLFLCKLVFVIQSLKVLSDKSRNKSKARDAPGRGSEKLSFANVSKELSEDELRKRFGQYGLIKELQLERDDKDQFTGEGSATFDHPLSSWIAVRMLNRSIHDGRVMRVELQGKEVAAPGKHEKQMSFGKPTSPESVLFYMNAPIKEKFNDMLARFNEVGEVASFRYWVDERTGMSRGMGTVSYGSVEASQAAFKQLSSMIIDGRKLKVSPYKKH